MFYTRNYESRYVKIFHDFSNNKHEVTCPIDFKSYHFTFGFSALKYPSVVQRQTLAA